jgi:beta-glucosidase
MKGRTYRYSDAKPLFAFGHGLSYTRFNYTKAALSAKAAKPGETVDVIVSVKNVGQRAGDEVVQVYAHANTPPVEMPRQWLVGFRRVHFEAGEAKDVKIPVKVDSLRRWDDKANRYTVDSGAYELRVGAASDRILQTAILNVQ